jgi:hypothetical protein
VFVDRVPEVSTWTDRLMSWICSSYLIVKTVIMGNQIGITDLHYYTFLLHVELLYFAFASLSCLGLMFFEDNENFFGDTPVD